MWVDLPSHRVESLGDDLMHLGDHVFIHVEVSVRVKLINYCLEPRERELVTVFEITIVLAVFLDRVVGQVDECIVDVVLIDRKFRGGRTQITFFEEK
jgi:hypothetical protein